MECIQGNKRIELDRTAVGTLVAAHERVIVDLGTGDGRFPLVHARRNPGGLYIGIDACRENLRRSSASLGSNMIIAIANAEALPREVTAIADELVINFPWGSLLDGLLKPNSRVWNSLRAIARPRHELEIRVNAGALEDARVDFAEGVDKLFHSIRTNGYKVTAARMLGPSDLRTVETTWAKRLAFGRDPRAIEVMGTPRSVSA